MNKRKFWLTLMKRYAPKLYASSRLVDLDDFDLQKAQANAFAHLAPDANGLLGATHDGTVWRNHDDGSVYGQIGAVVRDVMREEFNQMRLMLIASGGQTKAAELLPAQTTAQPLPERIPLRALVDTMSYKSLVLGVSDAGPVRANLSDLVHIAIGGSSGWGKSVFLRSIVYQLAKSVERVDLVLIDLEKTTFSPFYNCDRLLYPIIDDEDDAIGVFKEIRAEMDRRKALYENYPGVDSLERYNQVADEKLDPYVIAIDEGTALLSDKRVEKTLRTLALRARKFGMWFLFGGQDWKTTSIDSTIKYQFSTSIQFKTKSGAQSHALLGNACAKDINVQGRAFAILPGREMIEMQSPIIGHEDILRAMTGGGPRYDVPEMENDDLEDRVIDTWESMDKPNITKVTSELFDGQRGGVNWERVKKIAYSTGLL